MFFLKNKKKIRILIINIFLILGFVLFLDWISYKHEYKMMVDYFNTKKIVVNDENVKPNWYRHTIRPFSLEYDRFREESFRRNTGLNSTKPPIIVFGCSFAYGHLFPHNQTFPYKLSRLSNRPVYNRAYPSWGVQNFLYQLKRDDFYREVRPPEYIVYVFIDAHIERLYKSPLTPLESGECLRYKKSGGSLKEVTSGTNFLMRFFIVKKIQAIIVNKLILNEKNRDKNFDFMKLHFEEVKKIADRKYPGTKIVILKYVGFDSWFLNTPRWKELEKEGFIVLDTTSLTGHDLSQQKYKVPDGHPNEEAWDIITPALIKKLKL